MDDMKNTSGGYFILGERLITWLSKKHTCISQSIVEAECVATIINCNNIVWIKKLLKGMQEGIIKLVTIYCCNTSAINISKNYVFHAKTNHISIKYHYLREQVCEKQGLNIYTLRSKL